MKISSQRIRRLAALMPLILLGLLATGAAAATQPAVTSLAPVSAGVSTPVRIVSDQFGSIYLTDPRAGGVLKYDEAGRLVKTITLGSPKGLAVTPLGDIIVARGDSVSLLDPNGVEKRKLGQGAGQFRMANGVAIDDTGRIFVTDSLDNCVQVFTAAGEPDLTLTGSASGKPANSFGSDGSGFGQFSQPTGIVFESDNRQLAVVDSLNGRIQFFNADNGSYQKSIGSPGSGPLRFTSPQGVAFDYVAGNLARMYVVDTFQSNVQIIDPADNGVWLANIGGYGTAPGKLVTPSDLAFDTVNNRLLVVNGSGRINLYGIDDYNPNPLPDPAPPLLTIDPIPATVSSQLLTISGTVETGALVTVTVNSSATVGAVSYASTSSASTSVWSCQLSNLPAGATAITVTARDSAQNPTTRSGTVSFIANAVQLTVNQVVTPTNSTTQTISGTVAAGATVSVANNTTSVTGAATVSGTSWSRVVTLVEGTNNLTISASKGGATSSATSVNINVVTTLPTLSVSTLANNSYTGTQLLNVSGTAGGTPYFDRVEVTHNNGTPVVAPVTSGSFSLPVLLTPGTNSILVNAYDTIGNKATPVSRTINYDPSRPVIVINTPAAIPDGSVTTSATINLTGLVPTGATSIRVSYLQNGSPVTATAQINGTNWSLSGINLDPGLNTIQATAMSGNTPLSSAKISITRVTGNSPFIAITDPPAETATSTPTFAVSGTAGAATITARINGADVPVTFGSGSYSLNSAFSVEQPYLIAVTATDLFGNEVTTYRTIVYDITPPANVSLTSNIGQSTISGTAEAGSVIFLKDRSGVNIVPPITVGTSGLWSISLPGSSYDPSQMNLYVTDAAGNSSRNGHLGSTSGKVDITDAVQAMNIAMGRSSATPNQLLFGDVGPLVSGTPSPDGVIDTGDLVIILRRILGLVNF